MNHAENDKADELDRLLNDPEVALDPSRIWELAADLSSAAHLPIPTWTMDRRGLD